MKTFFRLNKESLEKDHKNAQICERTSDVLSPILAFSGCLVLFRLHYIHIFLYSISAFLGLFLENKSMQVQPSCPNTIEVLLNIVNVKQIISNFRGFKCIIHTIRNSKFTVFGVFHFHRIVKELLGLKELIVKESLGCIIKCFSCGFK